MANPQKTVWINGKLHRLVIFRIQSEYEDGTPEDCTLIKEEMTMELSTDPSKNKFMLGYVADKMIKPTP